MDHRFVARVLAEIAHTASETIELREIFDRVAALAREMIPFEHMGVIRILEDGTATRHVSTADGCCEESPPHPMPLTAWSPRIRPRPGPIARVDDARLELDPAFPLDARILEGGARSLLWESFQPGAAGGGVWINSPDPSAFNEDHQKLLAPVAALLGAAVEHWRLWDAERRRRKRLEELEHLLAALAETLDVRLLFDDLSASLQPVLPHATLCLSEHDVRGRSIRLIACAGPEGIKPPDGPIPMTEAEIRNRDDDYEIVNDLRAEAPPDSTLARLLVSTGMRSKLRVPVRLSGEAYGSLVFMHPEAGRYTEHDVEAARRVADRIALVISHQKLAEEARVASEATERAQRLAATVETLARELESQGRHRVVGESASWKEVLAHAARVASSDTTVLITGESGTGKEIVSRLIHQGSQRAGRPFVAVNCAALPEQLLESELFGHEKGAFTGATAAKMGRLEQAEGGTLLLDEIGEMSPAVQAKFLRVLEEKEYQRVGGTRALNANVRILAATNRDLPSMIALSGFREDLFYRLNVFEIRLPALRDRPEDILPLAEGFLEDLGRTMGRPAAGISRDAKEWLLAHHWPGNVRELRNAIERAILLCDGGLITREHLPTSAGRPAAPAAASPLDGADAGFVPAGPLPSDGIDLESIDRTLVAKALDQARGNKSRAARMLGLTRSQLYSRLEKYGLG